ncbi:MAG: SpoIIE family protein phosphatase [Actinomadura sp.]
MKHEGEPPFEALLPPETVLNQMEMAVIVCDRFSNVIYGNSFAHDLFGFEDEFVGYSVLSLSIAEEDHAQATELARHVLRGGVWEGTFCNVRSDGTTVYTRAHAVPLRHPSGAIDGIVIFAREALRSNQRDQDRYGLLERIGERLSASLELEQTLRQVADTLVPQFADHVFIDLFSGDRLVRRVSRHAGGWAPPPGTWAEVGEPIFYPAQHPAAMAMGRRDAVLVEDLVQHHFNNSPSESSQRLSSDMGLTSVISAPLLARGELLGVMSLALSNLTKRPDPHYDGFDRDLVGAIAGRVALAIDNAILFEEERATALAFQKNLLPGDLPPRLDGLQIAWRYEPAKPLESHGHGIQTQVGGDWYDVIPLSAGRVGIVIGDVEGRGPRAAAIMGQLRAALRAFAQDDKPPADILRKLDEWVRTMTYSDRPGDELARPPLVSCTYFVYDAWSRTLSFANAGHDPPMLIVDGEVSELEFNSKGAMLGVRSPGVGGDILYNEETCELKPGTTFVLYTDGLIERRPKETGDYYSREQSRQMLREAVAAAARRDVETIANAAYQAVPGDIDDDAAIVVVRTSAEELAMEQRTFPAEAIMVSEARRMAVETFASWGMLDDQAELACLLVSEVVTNVVLHAAAPTPRRELVLDGAPAFGFDESAWELDTADLYRREPVSKEFRLRLRRGTNSVWVEVFDSDMRLPRIRSAGETDEGGRGLYLVDQLATRWGSRPISDGKAVWFELPLS